jgi:ADP-heptose:LPS heptosyltransferase
MATLAGAGPRTRWDRRVSDAARELAQRSAAALCPGPRLASPPDWDVRPYRVLLIRTGSMGDTVLMTSLARAIARSHGTIEVDALVRAPFVSVLNGVPYVRQVIPFNCTEERRNPGPALMMQLRRQRYDVVIDGMINVDGWGRTGFPTAAIMLLLATGARYRIGQGGMRNSYIMNLPVMVNRTLLQVERAGAMAEPFGVDLATTDWRPELVLSDGERSGAEARWAGATAQAGTASGTRPFRLLVNITSTEAARRWRDERMVEVIKRVRAKRPGLGALITGLPSEEKRIREMAAAAGVGASIQPMRDALALCAGADALLSPDTGITHVATAFSVPTVVLMQNDNWMWAPYKIPSRVLIAGDRASLDSISADTVYDALDGLLHEIGAP